MAGVAAALSLAVELSVVDSWWSAAADRALGVHGPAEVAGPVDIVGFVAEPDPGGVGWDRPEESDGFAGFDEAGKFVDMAEFRDKLGVAVAAEASGARSC